ncbi:hypothetical protein D5S17_35365 [Pseudonocardiaceae bacterium YIM PH 21723]|nr:hypothetical protein D5S17_35365 [Pseudonocardiaceae bacterium YIM PH 21723]
MFAVPENSLVLPESGIAHPVRLAMDIAADQHRWAPALRFDPNVRWSGLLEHTAEREVWLMSWLPGQGTELHDHGIASGAFSIISGELTERVVRTSAAGRRIEVLRPLLPGQSRVFGPEYVHQITNEGTAPAVSVHVYTPARAAMTVYPDFP